MVSKLLFITTLLTMMDKIRKRIYLTFINDFLLHLIGDGLITLQELKEVLEACVKENGLSFTDDQLNQLTQGLYEDAIYNRLAREELGKYSACLHSVLH